jgi:regulator of sirC expression with transglutaminase-like and TPR domain
MMNLLFIRFASSDDRHWQIDSFGKLIIICLLFVITSSDGVCGDSMSTIRNIMMLPDAQIDLGKTILTIDKMINPAIDINTALKKIDSIVSEIQMGLPFGSSSDQRLRALRAYLYTPNRWNGNHPFEYDFSDPFGHTLSHKLIPHYLASKKGNCVSMPLLFSILGQRLGIDVTAATAPNHIFVKFHDEMGNVINLETTSGASPARDVWIRQKMPMSDEAIANGIYMRPLSKKETVMLAFETVLEKYRQNSEYEKTIQAADMVLENYPKNVNAMLFKGAAYSHLITEQFENKYSTPDLIPQEERAHYEYLARNNQLWYAKAEALGWKIPSEENEAKYKQSVSQHMNHVQ